MVDSLHSRFGSSLVHGNPVDPDSTPGEASRRAPEPISRRPAYDLLHLGTTDLVACMGPCMIIVVDTITPAGADAMARGTPRMAQRHEKICTLSVVERQFGNNMDPKSRQAITDLTRKYRKSYSGAAVVCEGTGFRATTVRSVVTAIHMASLASHPCKVFGEADAAIAWLVSTLPAGALDAGALTQAVSSLRDRLREQLRRAASSPPR